MSGTWLAFALSVGSSALATWIGARWASRAGLADDPACAPERKLQARAVPAVGGIAILAGLAAADWAGDQLPAPTWIGVLLAFLLGTVDDRRRGGLPPVALLLGQTAVAAALVAGGWRVCEGAPLLAAAASVLAVLAAMNALNAFDNADGAATSIGILGLGLCVPVRAGPLLGFLPWNLFASRGGKRAAYLGNSGSFVLGVLLLCDPIGRFALLLPLLDLARLVFVRTSVGSRPWIGDRRHLAHRLQKAGLSSVPVVLVLAAVAAPAVIGSRIGPEATLGGVIATVVLASAAVLLTPRIG